MGPFRGGRARTAACSTGGNCCASWSGTAGTGCCPTACTGANELMTLFPVFHRKDPCLRQRLRAAAAVLCALPGPGHERRFAAGRSPAPARATCTRPSARSTPRSGSCRRATSTCSSRPGQYDIRPYKWHRLPRSDELHLPPRHRPAAGADPRQLRPERPALHPGRGRPRAGGPPLLRRGDVLPHHAETVRRRWG